MAVRKRKGRSDNGTGTITKRSATSYEVKITIKDETGKSKRISKYFKTRAEAETFRLQTANEIRSGNYKDAGSLTVEDWCNYWFKEYNSNIRSSTKVNYEGYIKNKIIPHIGYIKLNALTTGDLQLFFNAIKQSGNKNTGKALSDKTVKNVFQMLHKCLGQAVDNDLIRKNFCDGVELPSQDIKEEMRVLNSEETRQLLYALDNFNALITQKNEQLKAEKSSTRYDIDSLGYRYAIYTALYTGARIGEVMGLKWSDISFDNNTISITKTLGRHKDYSKNAPKKTVLEEGNTKTTNGRRTVPMSQPLKEKLLEFKSLREELLQLLSDNYKDRNYVFSNETGNPVEPRTIQDFFKKLLMIASIEDANLHCLRHTFSTQWLRAGLNIKVLSSILGHSSVAFSMNVYSHALEDFKAEEMANFKY